MNALADQVFGAPEGAEDRERFRIQDDQALTWAMKKLRELTQEYERKKAERDELIERVNKAFEANTRETVSSIQYFQSLISEYHRQELERNPKRKTITTPYGKSKSRTSLKFQIEDEEKVLGWAKESGVGLKYGIDKTAIKKHIKETGELIDGMKVYEETDFSVSIEE